MTDDAPEMVTVKTTSRGSPPESYHPDPETCQNAPKRSREIQRWKAEKRGLEPCGSCAAENANHNAPGTAERDYNALVETLRDEMGVETVE